MTKKTQRMRPPTAESSRQANEARRHREVLGRLDSLRFNTRLLAVATLAAASMPPKMTGDAERRIALMKLYLDEAEAALRAYLQGDVDDDDDDETS